MSSTVPKPVLVTGSFRSGTTWVGRILAAAPELGWVAEPFHVEHRRGVFAAATPWLYTYVCDENEAEFLEPMRRTLSGRYSWRAGLTEVRRPFDLALAGQDMWRMTRRRARHQRALLKDPIALFSAPWLHRRFDAQVVVMVRHPGAILASMQRLGWRFNFAHLLHQPLLMRDLLSPWSEEIQQLAADREQGRFDEVAEAALVWRLMYDVAAQWRQRYPDWVFLRHEDLSLEPLTRFGELFHRLGLELTPEISQSIGETSSAENPVDAPEGQAHALARDSRANASAWQERVDADQLHRLLELVGDSFGQWYG